MPYIQGFLLAVPEENRERYREMCATAWALFRDHGATAMRETWGVDVPEGDTTSFPMAVKREPGETVVFAWVEWPDRLACDAGMKALRADPRMDPRPDLPFDGWRMMWGGFEDFFRAER